MSEAPHPERALELGAILLGTTHLTEEQLEGARAAQAESGGRLAEVVELAPRLTAQPGPADARSEVTVTQLGALLEEAVRTAERHRLWPEAESHAPPPGIFSAAAYHFRSWLGQK